MVRSRRAVGGRFTFGVRAIFFPDDQDIELTLLKQLEIGLLVGSESCGIFFEELGNRAAEQEWVGGQQDSQLHAFLFQLLLNGADEYAKLQIGC